MDYNTEEGTGWLMTPVGQMGNIQNRTRQGLILTKVLCKNSEFGSKVVGILIMTSNVNFIYMI